MVHILFTFSRENSQLVLKCSLLYVHLRRQIDNLLTRVLLFCTTFCLSVGTMNTNGLHKTLGRRLDSVTSKENSHRIKVGNLKRQND